ncbi:unnamed protein product [Rhizophagus irregularis]|nr:unnamed protein product [Rhizophagus irregularis]
MSLKRSIKSKSRSLNLRQRDDNSLNSTELIMNEGDSDKNYNNDDVEFNGPIEIPFEREENDFPDNIDGEPIEIFEQNENELPENIDEYESFENISDSDSENIFENSSLLNSSFDGEFGPYFSSSTSASIFAWITKHMIFEYFTGEFVHIITSNRLNCMRITSIIFHNENVKLKLQRFLRFEELPDRFKTSERASNINTRWLLEDKPIIVDPRVLVNKTSVWLRDQQKPSYYSYEVDEILYRYENTWKIRNICYRIRHPSEYCSFPQNSSFVPFGGKFKDFIRPFLKELKELEKGKIINIQGEDTLVVAGLGFVTADLPQGNDLAGVMRHNAKKGCRFCMIEKHESLKSFDDLSKELRYHQLMDREFEKILSSNSLTEQKVLCSELGLKNQKPVLDDLMFDRLLQTPHDIYHAIADRLRLAMILPHILRRFLKLKHLKQRSIDELQENLSVNSGLVINRLIQCWAIVAKCARFCFNLSFNDESYETLNSLLKQEIILLTKMFPQNFTHLPNLHINAHLQCHAKTFATLVNSAVGIKEMVHRTFKGAVPHTNGKMIERDLIKRYNTLQALRNIIDGTLDSRYNTLGNGYYQNNIFRSLLSSWYATSVTNYDTREIDEEEINSPVDFICEIRCRIKWKYYEISQNNFEPNMSIDGDIYNGLKMAYKDYFNFLEYIHNKKIVYFNYITYKVLNDNDESSII